MKAGALPAGYARGRERGAEIVALPSVIEAVCAAVRSSGSLYAWASAQAGAQAFTGRGAAYAIKGADGAWVVRHFRRGGLVARALGDRYLRLGVARPLGELHASAAARARGVATPEVVAAVIYPAGPLYRADIATRLVPDAADLADTVMGPDRGDREERMAAWRAAGTLLKQAFDAGVVHADLNLRNILVQPGADGPVAYLLDLDRAVVRDGAVGEAERRRMLHRLHRSRRKLERAYGVASDVDDMELW